MPLQDRQDFKNWLEHRNANMVGRRHGSQDTCMHCGNPIDDQFDSEACLVCLAEQFGTETAERWLAEAIAGFIRAASDPAVLARMLAESIANARELTAMHAPPPPE